jgi:uncharacterized OB-fold protein
MNNPIQSWRRQQQVRGQLGKTGTILTWTEIFTGGNGFADQTPYVSVLAQLADGSMQYGILADCDGLEIHVGMKIRATLRRLYSGDVGDEIIAYGLKFVPVL